ncbi:MAG: AAA family ATPase [spirochete symbiont of Stewartia floridana]|nr:MAG: AAA family ATPase [spirochete symbiont of Stewartia floridana]
MDNLAQEALGESEPFLEFQQRLSQAARVDRPVLLVGERGTGKELAARRLHFLSPKWDAPFVALNCAALSPGLIESELFGHESGAFTGAASQRKGRFEEADGGTLFLDEIGLIPMVVQEKILRVVEYGSFQRVGSSKTIDVEVRLLGATNQNLPRLCEEGLFKRDLLDRLSFEVLFIPPLRVRNGDIHILAEHFASRISQELGLNRTPIFSNKAKDQMTRYAWPGNIRELKNTIERAVYRERGTIIPELTIDPFQNPWPDDAAPQDTVSAKPRNLKAAIHEMEFTWLTEAMKLCGGHQGKAAKLLGLSYDQFRRLHRKHCR